MEVSDIFREVAEWTTLRDAIRAQYGVESEHVGVEHVVETCDDCVLWEGIVDVFRVLDDPRAAFIYVWPESDAGDRSCHVAVFGAPPIRGARDAVHAVMATRRRHH